MGLDITSFQKLPLLPLFMRATVLSDLMSKDVDEFSQGSSFWNRQTTPSLRQLVDLFVHHGVQQGIIPKENVILDLFDYGRILICIDGLDEASIYQELMETSIEHAVKEAAEKGRRVHVLISTREHSYVHSRACLRLGDFSVVNLQPLDEERRHDMLRRRLPTENIVIFQGQLAEIARKNPELARSPFLLSLMIEVYKKDGAIPKQRVALYSKQVEAIVSRFITNRIDGSFNVRAAAQKLATKYLETLAFVCQLRLEERDFTLAGCQRHMHEVWGADQLDSLSESEKNLFTGPIIGLLTDVGKTVGGSEAYRFSHLTLQEYLAAKCAVRLYGHDVAQLLSTLQPLHSRWKREVLLFAGCLLQPETVFEDFCRAVLQSDDGTGACCEMVRDFSKERGESTEVAQLVLNKLQEIRATETLIAGLCHPSLELRSRVLSEMDTFGMPHDPFCETDGTVAELKNIAKRRGYKWYERVAAILSMVQIAQMEHCQKGDNRTKTLRWVLGMLGREDDENVHYALVKGLGTLLKGRKDGALKLQFDFTFVSADDEKVLLHALGSMVSYSHLAVMEALADLNAYSDGLMEWALNKSLLSDKSHLSEKNWPMRHVLGVFCTKIASDSNYSQAVLLATHLFARVHAGSSKMYEIEKKDLHKGLKMMFGIIGADMLQLVLQLLRSGELLKRVRVMEMAADLDLKNFAHESLDELALCLLSTMDLLDRPWKMDFGAGSTSHSLLDAIMQHEIAEHEIKHMHASLFETSQVFRFLLDIFKPLAEGGGDPVKNFKHLRVFSQSCQEETRQHELERPSEQSSRANLARPLKSVQNGTAAEIGSRNLLAQGGPRQVFEQLMGFNQSSDEEKQNHNPESSIQKILQLNLAQLQEPAQNGTEGAIEEEIAPISLQALANVVANFTPQMLTNPDKNANLLELYCASRLWADSGLILLDSAFSVDAAKYFSEYLGLSAAQSVRYTDAFRVITEPWKYADMQDGRWDQAVLELMQDKMLGRILFKHVLLLIGQRQGAMADIEMKTLEADIQQWQPSDATEHVEKQFLLKELSIGKRSQQFPTWTGLVSTQTASAEGSELAVFLQHNGFLPDVAARISETMQMSLKHFLALKRGDIDVDAGELSFLKRQHKRLLVALVGSIADVNSCRKTAFDEYDADSDSNASVDDGTIVAGDSEDDLSSSICTCYHLGNADEILARLKMFFHGWMDENSFGGASANLSLCTILWIIFLREATYPPSQVEMVERWIDRIFHDDIAPIEDDFAIQVHSFVRDLVSHKLLGSIRKTINEFSTRPCVASIAIIDHMVVKLLVVDDVLLDTWNDHVVDGWYRSRVSPPSAFLARANEFIRDNVGSVQLLARVQTQ